MGVGVMQTKNEMFLEQSAYTKALLSKFGMDKANSVATPVDINADLVTTSDDVEDCDKDLYQSAVGLLLVAKACPNQCHTRVVISELKVQPGWRSLELLKAKRQKYLI
ncbi:hypothetical protein FHG87_023362 [Trinorchestia longiramus]|nr:hypothetical protein FHG87_023362 [Trinorchestia longiramus]